MFCTYAAPPDVPPRAYRQAWERSRYTLFPGTRRFYRLGAEARWLGVDHGRLLLTLPYTRTPAILTGAWSHGQWRWQRVPIPKEWVEGPFTGRIAPRLLGRIRLSRQRNLWVFRGVGGVLFGLEVTPETVHIRPVVAEGPVDLRKEHVYLAVDHRGVSWALVGGNTARWYRVAGMDPASEGRAMGLRLDPAGEPVHMPGTGQWDAVMGGLVLSGDAGEARFLPFPTVSAATERFLPEDLAGDAWRLVHASSRGEWSLWEREDRAYGGTVGVCLVRHTPSGPRPGPVIPLPEGHHLILILHHGPRPVLDLLLHAPGVPPEDYRYRGWEGRILRLHLAGGHELLPVYLPPRRFQSDDAEAQGLARHGVMRLTPVHSAPGGPWSLYLQHDGLYLQHTPALLAFFLGEEV